MSYVMRNTLELKCILLPCDLWQSLGCKDQLLAAQNQPEAAQPKASINVPVLALLCSTMQHI